MNPLFFVLITLVWLYILYVLKRAKLKAWSFLWGSLGLFVIMMVFIEPYTVNPLARCICAISGLVGRVTGAYEAYFKYGILFIEARDKSTITLLVDMECSGIIEIMAYLSLLAFFEVYTISERVVACVAGFAYICLCNAFRITIICLSVYFFGTDAFYIVHTFVGRIVFYLLSVLLYFYVFTKPQVIQMRVGNFKYGHTKKNS